jgi:hypothetical protein
MGWLTRLFRPQPVVSAAPSPAQSTAPVRPLVAATPTAGGALPAAARTALADEASKVAPAAPEPPLIAWLIGLDAVHPAPVSAAESQALAAVDAVLARPKLGAEMLPRAAAVMPRLIAMLRQGDLPVPVLAERIGRDPAIAAEVLRLSRHVYYGGGQEITDLSRAIAVLGADGVQIAITRVVLRPLYQAQAGSLATRAAARTWAHADVLSRRAAESAQRAGLAPFDGYLAGLLHGTGWTVLCRVLDLARCPLDGPIGAVAAAALDGRAHRLFGLAAQPWDITPAFTALTADARQHALDDSTLPLAAALRVAHAGAIAELSAGVQDA